ncbi:uncharacterized protein LOC134818271 isoform X1 [Bolinopsis microptera]|uniref:uncharacterized protein LOC134818271 isoform X1 n=1 Tax=Bolinopsis microptera TaxID=2820187 RepID=UPI003079493B
MTSSICVVLCLALATVEITAAVELEGKRQRPDTEAAEDLKDLLYSSMHNIVSLNDLVTELSEKIAKLTISSAENTAEMKLSKAETTLSRAARSKEIKELKTDAARVSEVESLKEQIGTLNKAFFLVLENKEVALAGMTAQMEAMKEEQVELDRDHAWQSLHMAAAAACRGSTPTGGSGPNGNAVLAKENTRSCDQVCGDTAFNLCDADISISGYKGQATSYSQRLGHYYNYGCGSPGNRSGRFDEVKAGGDGVFSDHSTGNWYYRFCCCRRA